MEESRAPAPAHDAFISYSRKDREFASRLDRALTEYRPPRDPGIPQRRLEIFRDEEDFTGTEYHASVRRHLESSAKLLVLCSPSARASAYVDQEIRHFAQARGAEHLIPILVAGLPNNEVGPERADQAAFPEALTAALEMPLAVDYRGFEPRKDKVHKGSYRGPWYAILANLYGVSRDRIEQRERAREARRRRLTRGIVTAVVVVLSAALVVSLFFWRRAVEQTRIAVAQKLAAQAELTRTQTWVEEDEPNLLTRRPRRASPLELSTLLAAESLARRPTLEADLILRSNVALLRPLAAGWSHGSALSQAAFSADRQWLATLSDSDVRVWEVATGRQMAVLTPELPVADLAFSPDGRLLATAMGFGWGIPPASFPAQVWDWRAEREPVRMDHPEKLYRLSFDPRSRWLVTLAGPRAQLWEAESGRPGVAVDHEHTVLEVGFDPTGSCLATRTNRGVVRVVAAADGRELTPRELPSGRVDGGALLEAATGHGELGRLAEAVCGPISGHQAANDATPEAVQDAVSSWESRGRERAQVRHAAGFREQGVSTDGRVVATHGEDNTARAWTPEGEEVARVFHEDLLRTVVTADGTSLVTVGRQGDVRRWDLTTGRGGLELANGQQALAIRFSPGGEALTTLGHQDVHVWDAAGSRRPRVWEGRDILVSSPGDGRFVALCCSPSGVEVLDWTRPGRTIPVPVTGRVGGPPDLAVAAGLLAAPGRDGGVEIWEIESGLRVGHHPEAGPPLLLSADGRLLVASTGEGGELAILEVDTGDPISRLPPTEGEYVPVGFALGGDRVVVADLLMSSPTFLVWDMRSHAVVARHPGAAQWMDLLLPPISPDGAHLVTAEDFTVRLWDLRSGREVARLQHPEESPIIAVTYGPTGEQVATGSLNGKVRIWDVASQRELSRLDGSHLGPLAFSPDGRRLATSGGNGVTLWPLPPADLVAEACARVTRNLRVEEWEQFLGAEPYRRTCPDLPVPDAAEKGEQVKSPR